MVGPKGKDSDNNPAGVAVNHPAGGIALHLRGVR